MKLFEAKQPVKVVKKQEPIKRIVLKAESQNHRATIKDELEFIKQTNTIRICIYRGCGGIGDILMCTPLLQAIKEQYPNYHLTFAIDTKSAGDTYSQLLKNNPYIDEVVSAHSIVRERYHIFKDISSVCLQYENSGLKWINRIDIFANACGFKLTEHKPFYKVEQEERDWAKVFIDKQLKDKPFKTVMLHTASYDIKRTWPIKKYSELISELNKSRSDLFYFVNDYQKLNSNWNQYKNLIDISAYGIREKAALLEQMNLFIGPDSGPMHLAGSLNVPGVILFGSIPPEARINYYPTLEAIKLNLLCSPCGYSACPVQIKCMRELDSTQVAKKALQKLNNAESK